MGTQTPNPYLLVSGIHGESEKDWDHIGEQIVSESMH